ncbi:MAG: Fur family transcriptional regulator [Anaerolineae bacterium]
MACEQVFIQQLHERGFRLTPQREIILSVLHGVEGLVTAEEIYQRVRRINATVDISTVYRTLDLLQELDLVSCVDTSETQRRYELLGVHSPHLHLVCQACGRVIAAELEMAREFGERLQAAYGFQPTLDHVSIPGLCSACAAARSDPPTPDRPGEEAAG